MKKTFIKSASALLMSFTLFSCMNSETKQQAPEKEKGQNTSVEFAFQLGDLIGEQTRALDDACPGFDEIRELISEDNIWAEFTIKDENGVAVDVGDRIALNFVNIGDGQVITDPMIFDIDFDGTDAQEACYYIEQVTIFKEDEAGDPMPLFSSMSSTSENAGWVDQSCVLSPWDEASAPSFCVNEENIYQKVTVDVCVYCTYDEDATYFGYIMWNIEFKRMICVPFMVNICNEVTFKDEVGVGTIQLRSGTKDDLGQFVEDDKEYGVVPFPTDQYTLADICFVDEMDVANEDEWYELTMEMEDGREFVAMTTVAELLTYESRPEYDPIRHYIHFWFCDGKDNWFFEAKNCGNLPYFFTLPTNYADIEEDFFYIPAGEEVSADNDAAGLPGYESLSPSAGSITIPAGTSFGLVKPYPFSDNGSTLTTITLLAVPQSIPNGTEMTITLYDGDNTAVTSTITETYNSATGSNQFRVNFADFTGLEQGNCYYIMISFDDDFELRDMSVNNFSD